MGEGSLLHSAWTVTSGSVSLRELLSAFTCPAGEAKMTDSRAPGGRGGDGGGRESIRSL